MVFIHTHLTVISPPSCLSSVSFYPTNTHTRTEKRKAACPATISTFTGVLTRPSLSPLMSLMTPSTPSTLRLARSPSPPFARLSLNVLSSDDCIQFSDVQSHSSLSRFLMHLGAINQTVIFPADTYNYPVPEKKGWWVVFLRTSRPWKQTPKKGFRSAALYCTSWPGKSLRCDIPRSHSTLRKNRKLWGLLTRLFIIKIKKQYLSVTGLGCGGGLIFCCVQLEKAFIPQNKEEQNLIRGEKNS